MLIIEIMENRNRPIAKVIREGKPDEKTFYEHEVYLHKAGLYPIECRLPAKSATHIITPGKYVLSKNSFKVGQYGDLQIDRYAIELVPLSVVIPAQSQK